MSNVEKYDEMDERRKRTEELKALGFDPKKPEHRAAVKVADKLELDLLLREVIVIPGKGPFITRDGLLTIAHRSGVFDGMEIQELPDSDTHWRAQCTVYRTDMSHPFTYPGRYPFNGSNKQYGPEMAIKVAESMALRRAFRINGIPSVDEQWDVQPEEPVEDFRTAIDMPDGVTETTLEEEEPY